MASGPNPFGKQIVLGGIKTEKNIWTTAKVDRYLYNLENGINQDNTSPFFDRKLGLRKGNINFKYTKEEEYEIEKCMNDIIYFADKYAFAMTDDGVQKINLRDYQRSILREFANNRYLVYLASRQVGKCFFATSYISIRYDGNIYKKHISDLIKPKTFLQSIKKILYKLFDILS